MDADGALMQQPNSRFLKHREHGSKDLRFSIQKALRIRDSQGLNEVFQERYRLLQSTT